MIAHGGDRGLIEDDTRPPFGPEGSFMQVVADGRPRRKLTGQQLAHKIVENYPDAVRVFGWGVLLAAAQPRPGCPIVRAETWSSVHNEPPPIWDRPALTLVAHTDLCDECRGFLAARRAAQRTARTTTRTVAASGDPHLQHRPDQCMTCDMASHALRTVTASAAPSAELARVADRGIASHQPVANKARVSRLWFDNGGSVRVSFGGQG